MTIGKKLNNVNLNIKMIYNIHLIKISNIIIDTLFFIFTEKNINSWIMI